MKPNNIMRFRGQGVWDRWGANLGIGACLVLLIGGSSSVVQSQERLFRDEIKSFDLKYSVAVEVAEILNEQFPLKNGFSANKGTNTIYVRIPDELVPEVDAFIARLEEEAAKTHEQAMLETEKSSYLAARQNEERQPKLQIYALQHVGAEELLAVIGELGLHNERLSVAVEPRSNSIVARGVAESLKELEALLLNLDKPGEADANRPQFDSVELAKLKHDYQELLSQLGGSHPKVLQAKRKVELIEQIGREADLTLRVSIQQQKSESQLQQEYEAAEERSRRVARDWHKLNSTDNPDRRQLAIVKGALNKAVRGAFQLRQQLKKSQVERAEKQLQTLRSRLQQRDQIAEQIISRRVDDLLATDAIQLDSFDSGSIEKRGSKSSPGSTTPDTVTSRPVQIEALDQGVVVLRGKKSDVDLIVRTIDKLKGQGEDVQSPPAVRGVVITVDPFGGKAVLISVGRDDGIKRGDLLTVRRNGKTIGRVKVDMLLAESANAIILSTQDTIEKGDEVQLIENESGDDDQAAEEPSL